MNWKDLPKLPLVLIALMFIVGAFMYPRLPAQIPTHWGASGPPDAYGAKSFYTVFMEPLTALGIYALFVAMPYFDPKRANLLRSKKAYGVVLDAVVALLAGIFAATIIAAFHPSFPMDRFMPMGVGLMFVVIGNYMKTVKRNFSFGVRFGWTVMDDVVWAKTNRLGGYFFMGTGALSLAGVFLPPPYNYLVFTLPMLGMLPILYAYSYALYKKRHPEDMERPPEPEM